VAFTTLAMAAVEAKPNAATSMAATSEVRTSMDFAHQVADTAFDVTGFGRN
jgi:hypothetical protein